MLQPRYYIPQEDVQMEHLTPTNTQTICPYNGFASYYSVKANGDMYPDPISEAPNLNVTLAFWPEKD